MWKRHDNSRNNPTLEFDTLQKATEDNVYLSNAIISLNCGGGLEAKIDFIAIAKEQPNIRFCFKNINQLKKWFSNEDLELLHSLGFVLKVISCPRKNHLAFKKQSIILNILNESIQTLWKQNLNSLIY